MLFIYYQTIFLLTSTTYYCIMGTEVHELLFFVYRNSCSLSSRLYKKIAASHRQLSLPAKKTAKYPTWRHDMKKDTNLLDTQDVRAEAVTALDAKEEAKKFTPKKYL